MEDRRPEDGARVIRIGSPERSVGEILGFKDSSKKRVFVRGNVIGRMSEEASINSIKVPNTKPPLSLG